MILSESRKGELYLFTATFLWSFFPIVTKLTFSDIQPLFSIGISTLFAAIFFAGYLMFNGTWREVMVVHAWKDIFLTSLFIGIIFYLLMFIAFQYTTAGNASILSQMEVFFTFLTLGVIFRKERLVSAHVIGAVCIVLGVIIVLASKASHGRLGDLMIIVATAVPPMGNYFAQRARKLVSSECIMFLRSLISGIVLLALAYIFEPIPSGLEVSNAFLFLFLNGFILFGFSKFLWLEAIHRIPISKAISLGSVGPAFTLMFAYFFLDETIQVTQILGFLPMLIGVHLLTKKV